MDKGLGVEMDKDVGVGAEEMDNDVVVGITKNYKGVVLVFSSHFESVFPSSRFESESDIGNIMVAVMVVENLCFASD